MNNLTWQVGIFKETGDSLSDQDNGLAVSGRVTYTPIYQEDGTQVVHLGIGARSAHDADSMRIRSRPEQHQTAYFVDTGHEALMLLFKS